MIKGTQKFKVTEESQLLEFLYNNLGIKSKNKVKTILKNRAILVNDRCVTAYDYKLFNKDVITYEPHKNVTGYYKDIDIIYNDKNYLAINKPSGLLSTSEDMALKNAYDILESNLNYKIFLVHRIDRDTSGILLFVKRDDLRKSLQEDWNELVLTREYYGVVKNKVKKQEETLIDNLDDGKNTKVIVSEEGKEAITKYKVIEEGKDLSLVKFNIETGRRNQIRVQMANIGNPILGDVKYGNRDFSKRLMLHASRLDFVDPETKQTISITSQYPRDFKSIIKRK